MGTPVLILILATAGALVAAVVARHAARTMRATFEVSPVSDYWLSQRKRAREEAFD